MNKIKASFYGVIAFAVLGASSVAIAQSNNNQNISTSGVRQQSVRIYPGSDGFTTEQRNVRDRLLEDNKPGAIKHLYVISPFSGQALIYSTVRGKVTSSGKRLAPLTVSARDGKGVYSEHAGIRIKLGTETYRTGEIIEDDGTYGSSVDYIYWWDTQGVYHQHFFTDGQIIHITNAPIALKSILLNVEKTIP